MSTFAIGALKSRGARALILLSLVLPAIGSAFTAAQGQKPATLDTRVGIVLGNAPAASDFAAVVDAAHDVVAKAQTADLIVVYEPYASTDPMPWPTPQLARRLRIAAALYHRKIAPAVVLYNDRYTRGPVNLATMMKIGLISLGVPAASIKAVARGEHRRLADVAKAYADTSAVVLTTAVGGDHLAPETAPKWKVVFVE